MFTITRLIGESRGGRYSVIPVRKKRDDLFLIIQT